MMEGYADIEGPVRIGLAWMFLYAAAALAALALLYLLYRLVRRRRQSAPGAAGGPAPTPLEVALGRLQSLRSGGSQLAADPFVVEVSDIVRDYLEQALAVPAREQTSEEFLQAVQARPGLPEVLKAHMPPFLSQCDMVKFARQSLGGGQREALLETAGTVVTQTDSSLKAGPEGDPKEAAGV